MNFESVWDNTVTLLKEELMQQKRLERCIRINARQSEAFRVMNERKSWIVGVAAVLYANEEETRSLHNIWEQKTDIQILRQS